MSDLVNITITLENTEARFEPGERISGEVTLTAMQEVKVTRVLLSLTWTTQGKGTVDTATASELTLHNGPTLSGIHTLPFRFHAPPAPHTYQGNLLKVLWLLKVRVDRPWAFDIYGQAGVLIAPRSVWPKLRFFPSDYME